MRNYRNFPLFCSITFRLIRICPNHIGRNALLWSTFFPFANGRFHGIDLSRANASGSLSQRAALGKLAEPGFFRRFKIPNIKFSRFTPTDLFFSAVYRGKLPAEWRAFFLHVFFFRLVQIAPASAAGIAASVASTSAVDVGTYLFASRLVGFRLFRHGS